LGVISIEDEEMNMENTSTISTSAQSPNMAEPSANDWSGGPNLESIRRMHLRTEATIKGIGGFLVVAAVLGGLSFLTSMGDIPENPLILVDLPGAIATLLAGLWLRDLDSAGRALYTVIALARVGLLAASLGIQTDSISRFGLNHILLVALVLFAVILPGILLLILWSRKARMVLSDYYQRSVLPVTGHVG
jgi:hypothetical protein